MKRGWIVLASGAICVIACERSAEGPVSDAAPRSEGEAHPEAWFENVAARRGLRFTHTSGFDGRYLFPESVCGGCALVDLDGDGMLDVYLVQSGTLEGSAEGRPPNGLFRNTGGGTFEDVTEGSGAGDRGYGMGVAAGDYDNDGDLDLYVTNLGRNALLRNDGGMRFTDVTDSAGVACEAWSSSAAFFDANNDGWLDLYVVNYIRWTPETEIDCMASEGERDYCSPKAYNAPAPDALYINNGDGTFENATEPAGLLAGFGNGLGVLCADFNGDGAMDVFVANDGMPDQLWRNNGDGTFVDVALATGCAMDQHGEAKAGMGVDSADLDGDLDPDLLVVNLGEESDSLYENRGSYFQDITASMGLGLSTRSFTRFGVAFVDFDHDGVLDLYEANGRVMRQGRRWSDDPYAEPNSLLRGGADGRFEVVDPRGGTAEPLVHASRGAAFGDVDNDGDVDVLVINRDGPAYLLLNVAEKAGGGATIRALDEHARDALGAVLTVRIGGRDIRRDVRSAYSYCSASDPRAHVGLGDAERIDSITVRWPEGSTERFDGAAAGAAVTLRKGQGTPVE